MTELDAELLNTGQMKKIIIWRFVAIFNKIVLILNQAFTILINVLILDTTAPILI